MKKTLAEEIRSIIEQLTKLVEAGNPFVKLGVDDIPKNEMIERSQGMFLIVERYASEFNDDPETGKPTAKYRILKEITPAEFFGAIDMPARGSMKSSDISNLLVNAFDTGLAERFLPGYTHSTLWVFRDLDGRTIHQHST